MGKGNSKVLSEQAELSKNYTIDYRLKEDNLTQLTHKETHHQYLLREAIFNDEHHYRALLAKLEQRRAIKSPYITQLERIEHFKEDSLCSNDFRIYSLWEYPRKTLGEEIGERALLRHSFSEFELRTLLLQVAQGLSAFQQHKKSHECLTTKTIVLTPNAIAKVVDILAVPVRPNLDVVFHKRSIKNTYLSPEQCRIIERQQFSQLTEDPFKEDIFVAGMIVLECALLERQDECYLNDYEGLNWPKLQERLGSVEAKYGRELRGILQEMLNPELTNRIDWATLIQRLNGSSNLPSLNEPIEPVLRVSVIERPVVRESVVPRVSVVKPMEQLPFKPRNSFVFTYNEGRQASSMAPRIQQLPVVRRTVQRPLLQRVIPVVSGPSPASNLLNGLQREQLNPMTISMSSKFTPIALTNIKPSPNNATLPQTQVAKEASTHSQPSPAPPAVKNFSLQLNEPVFSIDEYAEGKRYEGYKVNGKKEGEGSFYLDNKLCFKGHWKEDLMEGEGRLYYQSGAIAYDGHFEKDRFHGYGRLYNESPEQLQGAFDYRNFENIEEYWTSYEGFFENDLKEGRGELFLTNGEHFEGSFRRDCVEGEGTYRTTEGKVLRGVWQENKLLRLLE